MRHFEDPPTLEELIVQPGEHIVRYKFDKGAAVIAAACMALVAMLITLKIQFADNLSLEWMRVQPLAPNGVSKQEYLDYILFGSPEQRRHELLETQVSRAARPMTTQEWFALSARNVLHSFSLEKKIKGSDAHRLALLLRDALDHTVLSPRVERAHGALHTGDEVELHAFLALFAGDAFAIREGYLHSAQAMLSAERSGQTASESGKHAVDKAFKELDPFDPVSISTFIIRYNTNHYAQAKGYVAQAIDWKQQSDTEADEEEERMRLRQNSVPWIWD